MNRAAIVTGALGLALLAGCSASTTTSNALIANRPQPTATPSIVSECQIVNYPQPNITALDNAEADNFNGPSQGSLINASANDRAPVYQITLTDNGQAPAMVNNTDTVLFSGTEELTSDAENIGQLISPGASLTFTFPVPSALVTSQTDNYGNPVDYATNANNCVVEQWN